MASNIISSIIYTQQLNFSEKLLCNLYNMQHKHLLLFKILNLLYILHGVYDSESVAPLIL